MIWKVFSHLYNSIILSPTYPQLSGCHWERCSQPVPASSGSCCSAGSSAKLGLPEAQCYSNVDLYRKQSFTPIATYLLKHKRLKRSHALYTSTCMANQSRKVSAQTQQWLLTPFLRWMKGKETTGKAGRQKWTWSAEIPVTVPSIQCDPG